MQDLLLIKFDIDYLQNMVEMMKLVEKNKKKLFEFQKQKMLQLVQLLVL
jgi:hypothetical protein